MPDRVFTAEQFVPAPRRDVFAFFSNPANLEAITPPWLRFRITGSTTPEIGEGTELSYRLSLHGIPVGWRSRIEEWRPEERFVDVQLAGPYAEWHHTHTFRDEGPGTVIGDRVRYRLPLGPIGHWVAGRRVDADVRRIFDYRARTIARLLGGANG